MNKLICTILGVTLTACSFVSLDPEARDVVVQNNLNSVKQCKYLGDTNVNLWSHADTFQSQNTVDNQFDTLARNQAVSMGGNAVVAKNDTNGNTQRVYNVYQCPSK